jgi:hypothetical protein
MPAPPQVIWTDHKRRLVLMEAASPENNQYYLEVREGDADAMGKPHWRPLGLDWDVFRSILQSVLAWKPVELTQDEMQ